MMLKPITTEKAISGIELRNTITFEIDRNITKAQVKKEVEKEYSFKVARVNTLHTPHGAKRAVVKFKEKGKAAELASKLKLV